MYEIATGEYLWYNFTSREDIDDAILNKPVPDVQGVSQEFKDLMKKCLQKNKD